MKFRKSKKTAKKFEEPLDKILWNKASRSKKRRQVAPVRGAEVHSRNAKQRGRPPTIQRDWVIGRAYNYNIQLSQVWPRLEGSLMAAQTEEEVVHAFENNASLYAQNFVPGMVPDILAVIRDPKFPKRQTARVNFLADSLAGRPSLSFRSSRDICEQDRAKEKHAHRILRYEYYIECSCGYKGHSKDHGCPKCRAKIEFGLGSISKASLFLS